MVQRIELRVMYVFPKCSTTDPHPQIFSFVFQAAFEHVTFLSLSHFKALGSQLCVTTSKYQISPMAIIYKQYENKS